MCEKIFYRYKCGCSEVISSSCVPVGAIMDLTNREANEKKVRPIPVVTSTNGSLFPLPGCKVFFPWRKVWTEVPRLCVKCRPQRLKAMRDIKPGTKEWDQRYDWKSWDLMGVPNTGDKDVNEYSTKPNKANQSAKRKPIFPSSFFDPA